MDDNYVEFAEHMARMLKEHPELEEQLQAARRRLAPFLYAEDGRDCRMMCGELPARIMH